MKRLPIRIPITDRVSFCDDRAKRVALAGLALNFDVQVATEMQARSNQRELVLTAVYRHGLSQRCAGRLFGIGARTVARWCVAGTEAR